jgi:anti-sigma-K factor RskA
MKIAAAELIDHLASQFALGQLSPRVMRRVEAYARDNAALRSAIAEWQERVHLLAVSVPPQTPSPVLWSRIEARLFGANTANASKAATTANLSSTEWWEKIRSFFSGELTPIKLFATGAIGAALAVMTISVFVVRPKSDDIAALKRDALPQSYVGLLLDSKDVATLLASSLRHGKTLTVKMLKPLPKEANTQYRLWAMPNEGAPFSVGLVPQSGSATIALPDTSEKLFFKVQRLVVFAEPVGASNTTPSGSPILSGHCVKLW